MAYRVRFKGVRNLNIGRVITKIVVVVITLWVGGEILTSVGNVMTNTSSPFYNGLTLIGWTVGSTHNNGTDWGATCGGVITAGQADPGLTTCLTATNGSGILTVVGLIGIAAVVLEFVEFSRMG